MTHKTYEVYLTDEESPVESEYVDFYDSGAWVHEDSGRVFYPYERVEKIAEVEEAESEETEPAATR